MEKKQKPTQKQEIIRFIKETGAITAYDAVIHLGILQLSSRLGELESMGWVFNRKQIIKNNRYGRKVDFYCYSIAKEGINP